MIRIKIDNPAETAKDAPLVPKGEYVFIATEMEKVELKSGAGHRLAATLEVVEGAHRGTTLKVSYNLWHENPMARKIAERDISRMALAIGHSGPLTDLTALLRRPFRAGVMHREFNGRVYADISGYSVKGPTSASMPQPGVDDSVPF